MVNRVQSGFLDTSTLVSLLSVLACQVGSQPAPAMFVLGVGKVSQVTMPGGWKLCLCPSGTLDCPRCLSGTQRRQGVCESTHAHGMFSLSTVEPHP